MEHELLSHGQWLLIVLDGQRLRPLQHSLVDERVVADVEFFGDGPCSAGLAAQVPETDVHAR